MSRSVGTLLQFKRAGAWLRAIRIQLSFGLRPPQYEWQYPHLDPHSPPRSKRVARVEQLLAEGGSTSPWAWSHLAHTTSALYWLLPALTTRPDLTDADRAAVAGALITDLDTAARAPYDRVRLLVQLATHPAWTPHVTAGVEAALRRVAPPGQMARLGEELGTVVRMVFPEPLVQFPWLIDGIRRATAVLSPGASPWQGPRAVIAWATFSTAGDLERAMVHRELPDRPNEAPSTEITVPEWEALTTLALVAPSPTSGAALATWIAAATPSLRSMLAERWLHHVFVTSRSREMAGAWLALGDAGLGAVLRAWTPSPSMVAVLTPSVLTAWPASAGAWRSALSALLAQASAEKLGFWLDPRMCDRWAAIAQDPELVATLLQHESLDVRLSTLVQLSAPPRDAARGRRP